MAVKSKKTRQMRVRLPEHLITALQSDTERENFNDAVVWYLQLALDYRLELSAMRQEMSFSRAFGLCFSVAEAVTGKTVKDHETARFALTMVSAMAEWTLRQPPFSKTKDKGRRPSVQSAIEALLRLGDLDTQETRENFRLALALSKDLSPRP